MYSYYDPCVLCHHGVKGMKWGVRKRRQYYNEDGSMRTNLSSDSAITKRVKRDYNTLSGGEFRTKYGVKRKTYKKRVNRKGDPYKANKFWRTVAAKNSRHNSITKAKKDYRVNLQSGMSRDEAKLKRNDTINKARQKYGIQRSGIVADYKSNKRGEATNASAYATRLNSMDANKDQKSIENYNLKKKRK